jgi:APA family basic amino acid/polyamine antiporter
MVLIATRSYGQLLDYVTFADWIFFGATAATIVVYRRRESGVGNRESGGFRLPGYPVTLAVFLLAAGYVVVGSISSNPANAIRGAGLLLLGLPVFWYWSTRRARSTTKQDAEHD